MYPQVIQVVEELLKTESLPDSYGEDARSWFLPYTEELLAQLERPASRHTTFLLGINGAQGTGKSTLARLITKVLETQSYRVANLSIDDFYLTKQARQALAHSSHPLLATRGVPGTHDTDLLHDTLQKLIAAQGSDRIRIPRFDKAADDRLPAEDFTELTGPIDVIILEGWFVGVAAQEETELLEPINELEHDEDNDGRWRTLVNSALKKRYQTVFESLDQLLMLRAPSFEQVYQWRGLQEEKLRQSHGNARSESGSSGIMNTAELQRFIQHYERLTRHCLKTLPTIADTVFELDAQHRVINRIKRSLGTSAASS